jgi:hypothetical protein
VKSGLTGAQGAGSQTGHASNLHEGMVALARDVDQRWCAEPAQTVIRDLGKPVRQRHQHGRHIRLCTTAREIREDAIRIESKSDCKVPERCSFDLVRSRCVRPGGELRIVECRERIGDNAGRRHARIEETKVARVGDVCRVLTKKGCHATCEFVERYGPLEVDQ